VAVEVVTGVPAGHIDVRLGFAVVGRHRFLPVDVPAGGHHPFERLRGPVGGSPVRRIPPQDAKQHSLQKFNG
jgi:hypothetical protein